MQRDLSERFDLSGKVAAITGAGGALCGAMADALGTAGVKVAVIDIDAEKAEARAQSIIDSGGAASAFQCDVVDNAMLRDCCKAVSGLWDPPDLLINGAGGNDPRGSTSEPFHSPAGSSEPAIGSFFDLDASGFRRVFDLNFMGTFLTTQAFSDDKGNKYLDCLAAYSAAKAAVSNFTRWLAVHFAHTGVRVNALAPGFFMTEQLKFLHIDQDTGELLPRGREVIAHTPMGRYGRPDDLIGPLVWLLSDASSFVTGAVVPIDGGFSSYSI